MTGDYFVMKSCNSFVTKYFCIYAGEMKSQKNSCQIRIVF